MSVPGDQVPQAPSVRIPPRFPLVSKLGFRSTKLALTDPTVRSPVSDAALINAYAELDTEDGLFWVQKRLGTGTIATVSGTAGGVGVSYQVGGPFPVSIFGSNIYEWTGAIMNPGTYLGTHAQPLVTGRPATFLPVILPGIGSTLFWCVNGGMWLINSYAPFGYISILDYATSVPWTVPLCDGVAYLDYTMYVMDVSGNIWGSNINDQTMWLGTTLIKAGGRGDAAVGLAQQLEYIIAFKTTSYRCFYDAGSSAQTSGVGSNLAWVEGADGNFGLANAGSLQLIDQTLLWLTSNDKNTPQIARMDGLQTKIVSTPPVERLLQALTMGKFISNPNGTTNILYSSGIKRGGHRFYVLTIPATSSNALPFTLVYDLDQELWYIWATTGLNYWSVTSCSAHADKDVPPGGSIPGVFAQDISSGAFYAVDIDQIYPTDSGALCQVDIYTPNSDMKTRRKKQLNAMLFVNDQVSGSVMYVRKSDDDYRSWSPFRKVDLSVQQPSLTRCGSFRRRALNLRHYAATPFRIKASDVQIDLGTL